MLGIVHKRAEIVKPVSRGNALKTAARKRLEPIPDAPFRVETGTVTGAAFKKQMPASLFPVAKPVVKQAPVGNISESLLQSAWGLASQLKLPEPVQAVEPVADATTGDTSDDASVDMMAPAIQDDEWLDLQGSMDKIDEFAQKIDLAEMAGIEKQRDAYRHHQAARVETTQIVLNMDSDDEEGMVSTK